MNEISTRFENLIEESNWKVLKKEIDILNPIEIAEVLRNLSSRKQLPVFKYLTPEKQNEVFHHLSHKRQKSIIEGLINEKQDISLLLNNMAPDVRTAFLEDLPEELGQKLVQMLSRKEWEIAIDLLSYPEDSIGRLMTPEYVAIKATCTISEALRQVRKQGRDSETINVVYIVDESGKLIDDIRIREIILADPKEMLSNIIDHRFVSLNAYDDEESAIKVFLDHDRVALPVVDKSGILIGIVTFDDVMHVADKESVEDFQKFGSIQEGVVNPLKEGFFKLYKLRIVWLMALVVMNIFSGAALSSYEHVIQSAVSLVFFLPLLIDSSGNAGSQSATLMIRSLAVGDVQVKDWIRLLGKELLVSMMLGVTMAMGVAMIAHFRAPEVVVVVSITMFFAVIAGSMIGMLLPFIFTKLKLDPATASAPLITSISDITGVIIYFSIASWYLGV